MTEAQEPRSEYYEFDYQGLVADLAETYRQVMERDYVGCMDKDTDPDDIEASQTAELKPLVEQANKVLAEQGLIGANGVFMTGGLVPQMEGYEIERTLCDGPVFGKYFGLGLVQEDFGFDEEEGGEVVLSRPRITHRLKMLDAKLFGVDHEVTMRLYATLPIDSEAFEIITNNNQANLPNQRWLKRITDDMKNPDDGIYDFDRMYKAFQKAASAEDSPVPSQLGMDWLIDHLNTEMDIVGADVVVYTNQLQIYRPDDVPEYWYGGATEENYVEGRCSGFGVIDEVRKVEIDGEPKMIPTDKQGIGLILESRLSSGLAIVKLPLSAVGAVYSAEEHAGLSSDNQ